MKSLSQHQLDFNIKFGFEPANMTLDKLIFRHGLAVEEVNEMGNAIKFTKSEEVVDALIDQLYITFGTLHMLGIDVDEAFFNVHFANMKKVRGSKTGRLVTLEESYDVVKPLGWVRPDHKGNTGILDKLLETK